ncbi:MFS transporter [Devosia sp.]|uniref:MFS transporter n=1 Tax=Devosia sp. TaxID=1871048 RepID=UPI0025E543C8|nr:MFS transporter [Devosia sp.]MCR6635152.1 MFS transporter [Devosia sp.]
MKQQMPLVALAIATIGSIGGTRLSAIAIPWLVLSTTNSPLLTGLAGLAEMLPYVLAKALIGPFIDRLGARRIAIWCDYLSAAAVSIIPLLYLAGFLSIWLLLPAVAVLGVLRAPSDAAKQALVPEVAETGKLSLERVTGILGTSNRLAGTLGAAGAGVLIASLGAGPALFANAAAFVISALALALGLPKVGVATAENRGPIFGNYRAQMAEGWAAFSRDPILVALVIMLAFTGLFDQAYATVLLPVWVRSAGLDASWVGILLAVFSGAAIAGAAFGAFFAERLPRLAMYVIGFIFAGPVPMAALALSPALWLIVSTLLISGFAAGFLNPIIGALLFERIPKPVVGRVIALVGSLTWVLIPFGGIYAGLLTDTAGILTALGVTAALYCIAALSPAVIPRFRAIGKRPVAQPAN